MTTFDGAGGFVSLQVLRVFFCDVHCGCPHAGFPSPSPVSFSCSSHRLLLKKDLGARDQGG